MREKESGSYTVEVSLIMPFVLGTVLLVIYFTIFVHDKAVMESATLYSCTKAGYEQGEGNIEEAASDYLYQLIDEGLIGDWDIDTDICLDGKVLTISLNGNMAHSQGFITDLIDNRIFEVDIKQSAIAIRMIKWEELL